MEANHPPTISRLQSLAKTVVRALTSVPALTLLMLVVIDLFLRCGNVLDAMGYHTVDVWALPPRIELSRKATPDVALIGSSLLLVLNQDEEGTHFYSGIYPPYFQEQLRKASGVPITSISLCSGLQMPPEAYLITKAITAAKDYPRVLIYGVALRDFIHDQYALEWSCDSFASIAPYVPLHPDVLAAMTSPNALRELVLSHAWYLYRNRTDFKAVMSALTKDFLENLPLDMSYDRLSVDHQWRPQRQGFLFERWVPRQQERFTEAIFRARPEFLKRYFTIMQADIYRQGSEKTMRIQIHYLEKLIALCQRKGIHLVLVNMPLSPELAVFMPPGLYDAFRQFLAYIADKQNVAIIDLFDDPEFGPESFKDGVHLSYPGAKRLAERLTHELKTKYPDVFEAMVAHAEARQRLPDKHAAEAPYSK